MTKEEFYYLAGNKPEITLPTVYKLIIYSFDKDVKHYHKNCKTEEWYLTLSTVQNLYSSKESAENALISYINSSEDGWGQIHHALIQRILLDEKVNEGGTTQWWLYDSTGTEIDHSLCSDIVTDEMTVYDVFFGRKPNEIRFKPGDIVEYMDVDNQLHLTVLNDTPPTIEMMWQHYEDSVNKQEPNSVGKFNEPYFVGAMKDMYYFIQSNGFDPDAPVYCFFKPTLSVPEKAKKELTARYKRWKAHVDDAVSDKISWDELEKIVQGV